jgi:DNA-binding transcriptional LysR family regulator
VARMVNLRQLEAFRALMLTGTTVQAASMLSVTQPAISRLIADLEYQAGLPLFARSKGRLRPTPEAEALFTEMERAYVGLEHIADFMKGIRRLAGTVRLLATMPMAHGILPGAIVRFRAQHPDTIVTVKTVLSRDIRSWLDTQQFDIALTNFPVDYPLGSTAELARTDGVCILPIGHELTSKSVITAGDLADQPFIAMAPESRHRQKVDGAFATAGILPHIVVEAQTSAIISDLVAAGAGVSIVDPISARAFAAKGLEIRPFEPQLVYEFRLLFPMQKARSLHAKQFTDLVISYTLELGFHP